MTEHVDLSEVRAMLRAALDRCNQIDRVEIPDSTPLNKRERAGALAEVQRLLLFLSHLCSKAQITTMDEYHLLRGFTDHLPNEERP